MTGALASERTRQCALDIPPPQAGLSTRKSPARGSAVHQGKGSHESMPEQAQTCSLFAARCDHLIIEYRLSPGREYLPPRPALGIASAPVQDVNCVTSIGPRYRDTSDE